MGNSQKSGLNNFSITEKSFCYSCSSTDLKFVSACKFHQLCAVCSVASLKLKFSVCCLNDLTNDKIVCIRSQLGLCVNCSSITSNTSQVCFCNLCDECIQTSLSSTETSCSTCRVRINRLNYMNCKICYKYHKLDSIINHHGCSSFCKPCLQNSFLNSLSSQREFQLKCPSCKVSMGHSTLQEAFTEEQFNRMSFEFAQKKSKGEWCSKCQNYSLNADRPGPLQNCRKCSGVFCKNCTLELNSCRCEFDFRKVFQELKLENLFVIKCPNCTRPYIKDRDCAFVSCLNTRCKEKFCSECSNILFTVDGDGRLQHKIHCKFYRD